MVKCGYCGCDSEEHAMESEPLGTWRCGSCQVCPLIEGHVEKIFEQ